MTDLPVKIDPCPIKEVVFELRFSSSIPEDAIFGIVFNQFKEDYNNTATPLPILEVPAIVRNQDPNLIFAPHYKMESELFNMQIGPKSISLVNIGEYIGWDTFEEKILDMYERLTSISIISNIDRLALRYINIFPDVNIFHNSSIGVMLDDEPLESSTINLSTQLENNDVTSSIRVISGAQVQLSDETIDGSVLDIDSSMKNIINDSFNSSLKRIHNEEKSLFYKIIGSEHLAALNPEYK